MKISVVIPTRNRRQSLERCLPSVLAQDYPRKDFEIIVVVDPSVDSTVAMLRKIETDVTLRIIDLERRAGLAGSRNVGARAAAGEIILFLDDDIECDHGLVAAHVAAHGSEEDIVAYGAVDVSPSSPSGLETDWAVKGAAWVTGLARSGANPWPYLTCIDANNSLRRSLLLLVGGYDEELRVRENVDLGLRLWREGASFKFVPDARAYHLYVKSATDLVSTDASAYGREEMVVCRRYPEYRPHSALAGLRRGSTSFTILRETATRLPLSPEPLLRLPYRVASRFRTVAFARLAGVRLLQLRQGVQVFRSARQFAGSWESLRREFGVRLPILLYHHVGQDTLGEYRELTVSPATFERDIRWLSRHGYTGIGPSQWLDWIRQGTPLPNKPVLITFDDAYADIAKHALPVLEKYRFRGLVFVMTERVGSTTPWDGAPTMRADEIADWSRRGIDFGAHTKTHPDLTKLSDAELDAEIRGSKADLEAFLGMPVTTFAYPFGLTNSKAVAKVRNTYDLGFSTIEGVNDLSTDLSLLKRAMVHEGSPLAVLRWQLRFGYNPIQRVRFRLAIRTRARRLISWILTGVRRG
jgi:glycosyltransferase involved in cell wall biosynthesis/peptidoglycan/xylan/chitin deacetylase (PgdA/CDA1 family)